MPAKPLDRQEFQAGDAHQALEAACQVVEQYVAGNFKLTLDMEIPAKVRIDGEDHLSYLVERKHFPPKTT